MTLSGTPTLNQIAENEIENFSDEQFLAYRKLYKHVLESLNNNDWLMPFFCQYDSRNIKPSFAETTWMALINGMIKSENLFMALVPTKSWAYSDKMQNENFDILRDAGFIVNKSDDYSDGVFNTPDCGIKLGQVYMTDELTPAKNTIPKKHFIGSGSIEFGTQSLSKTAYYLKVNRPLVRLPYDPLIPGLKPYAALFVNYQQFDPFDF